jgi:hypothetical protein
MKLEKTTFARVDANPLTIPHHFLEEHDKNVQTWCLEKGIDYPSFLAGGTQTASPTTSVELTNTVNNDDTPDNLQDDMDPNDCD